MAEGVSRKRAAVGGDHLDGARQVGDGGAVEEPVVVGQADVGQQVAVANGLGGQHPGDVLADHQAGHAGVAAEELVDDRDDADVVAPERCDEWRQHLRPHRAGQDRDRRVRRAATATPWSSPSGRRGPDEHGVR